MDFSQFFRRFLLILWLGAIILPLLGGMVYILSAIFAKAGDLTGGSFFGVSARFLFWGWGIDLGGLLLLLASESILSRK